MSPLHLFLQADVVVKAVMIGLVLASIFTWAIIVATCARMRRINRENDRFEQRFLQVGATSIASRRAGPDDLPSSRVVAAGIAEWRRSTGGNASTRKEPATVSPPQCIGGSGGGRNG